MSGSGLSRPPAFVRTLQIVVAAMTAGCILFLAIALVFRGSPAAGVQIPVLTCILSAMALMLVGMRLVVPRIVVAQARAAIRRGIGPSREDNTLDDAPQSDEARNAAKLIGLFVTRTIMAAALLEGAVLMLLVAYLVEGSALSLGFAVVLIAALAAHFPTASGAAAWVEDQARLLDEERSC